MADLKTRRTGGILTMKLSGNLDIYGAANLKERLLTALDSPSERYELDVSGVNLADLAGIQLVLAFRSACLRRGKAFRLKPASDTPFTVAAGELGIRPAENVLPETESRTERSNGF